jgi:hypothetical protein
MLGLALLATVPLQARFRRGRDRACGRARVMGGNERRPFSALLLAAPFVMAAGRSWRERAIWLALGGLTLLGALFFPHPQIVWSTWPAAVGLLCLFIELTAIVALRSESPLSGPIDSVAGAVPSGKQAELSGRL